MQPKSPIETSVTFVVPAVPGEPLSAAAPLSAIGPEIAPDTTIAPANVVDEFGVPAELDPPNNSALGAGPHRGTSALLAEPHPTPALTTLPLFEHPEALASHHAQIALTARARRSFEDIMERINAAYRATLTAAISDEERVAAKSLYLQALRAMEDENENCAVPDADRTARLFYAYRDVEAFADMIRLYESSHDDLFRESDVIRELYVVALNKTKQVTKSLAVSASYIDGDFKNGEVLAGVGKAFRVRALSLRKLADAYDAGDAAAIETAQSECAPMMETVPTNSASARAESTKDMESSFEAYLSGYKLAYEYYPGVNAVYNLIELGRADEADRLAHLVYLSTVRVGGKSSTDYWCLATMMELALIGSDISEVYDLLPRMLRAANSGMQINSTLAQIKRVLRNRKSDEAYLAAVEYVITQMQLRRDDIHLPAEQSNPDLQNQALGPKPLRDDVAELIHKVGFNYTGCSTHYVPGNIKYNGILHDHVINRRDRELALYVLKSLRLCETTDFEIWDTVVNNYLEVKFHLRDQRTGVRDMEYLDCKRHHDFEHTQEGALALTVARETKRSFTNIMVDVAYGQGDCRNVAYAKQLLFDVWKDFHIGRMMELYYHEPADSDAASTILNDLRVFMRKQLFVCDVIASAPVVTRGKYQIVRNDDGIPLAADVINDLEDHTLNVLGESEDDGAFVDTGLRDGFYHVVYQWSRTFIDAQSFTQGRNGSYKAGTMLAARTDGTIVEQDVMLKPTEYSGKRDYIRPGDRGELLFRGEPVELDPKLLLIDSGNPDGDEDRRQKRRILWEELRRLRP